jgi:hypothetical protein
MRKNVIYKKIHACLSYFSTQSPPELVHNVYLNFFGMFDECVCIHCFDCSLVSTFTNETQVSSPVFFLWGGTYVTRYCGHFWPIVQPQMIDQGDCGVIGGMKIG